LTILFGTSNRTVILETVLHINRKDTHGFNNKVLEIIIVNAPHSADFLQYVWITQAASP